MKSVMQINQEILRCEKIVVWKNSFDTQKIMCQLIQQNIKIDAFCGDIVDIPEILGKRVISVEELVTWSSYALLVSARQYDELLNKYLIKGLREENLFAWIEPQAELIYI